MGKGRCIVFNNRPYRIREIKNVVVATHSHTRTKVEIEDVFTGEKKSLNLSPHDSIKEVEILRKRGQFIARTGDNLIHVMDLVSFETFDANVDNSLLQELQEGDEVTFVEFEGFVKVIEKR